MRREKRSGAANTLFLISKHRSLEVGTDGALPDRQQQREHSHGACGSCSPMLDRGCGERAGSPARRDIMIASAILTRFIQSYACWTIGA